MRISIEFLTRRSRPHREPNVCGAVSEWPKEHAWKACVRKRTVGSNPTRSAIFLVQPLAALRPWFFETSENPHEP